MPRLYKIKLLHYRIKSKACDFILKLSDGSRRFMKSCLRTTKSCSKHMISTLNCMLSTLNHTIEGCKIIVGDVGGILLLKYRKGLIAYDRAVSTLLTNTYSNMFEG